MIAWRACLGALLDEARSRFRRWVTVTSQVTSLFVFPIPRLVLRLDPTDVQLWRTPLEEVVFTASVDGRRPTVARLMGELELAGVPRLQSVLAIKLAHDIGVDELERATAGCSPERVAEICAVPASQVEAAGESRRSVGPGVRTPGSTPVQRAVRSFRPSASWP